MKAFIVDRYKKKGALRLGDMPEPVLQDDDVLVQAHAAGFNLLDTKIRDGEFKLILPYRPPFILGHDVAGTVVRVGSKVGKFKPGDEIYARPRDGRVGTFAELIALNEADVARTELVPASGFAPSELRHPEEGQASSRQLFIPVHARERRAVVPDHIADRSRHHSPRHGSGLPVRSDQRSLGLHRDRTVEGQSRGQGEVKAVLPSPGSKEQRRGRKSVAHI